MIFFFKQKTAYGMRISDWSSDVCSSDLIVLAAGDTFRAAAVSQLKIWGERAGARVITGPERADPAGLAFDALTEARAIGADILLIDTAGRLHNKARSAERRVG